MKSIKIITADCTIAYHVRATTEECLIGIFNVIKHISAAQGGELSFSVSITEDK